MDGRGLRIVVWNIHVLIFIILTSHFLLAGSNPSINFQTDRACQVDTTIQVTICEGLVFTLNGVEYDSAGIYTQQLIASNGCDSIITLDLILFPDPPIVAEFGFQPTSCEGAEDGFISVLSVDGTRPPFIFTINDSVIPPPNTLVDLPAGTYEVSIQNEYGCFDKEVIIIEDGPALEIDAGEDVTIPLGHSILLQGSSNLPLWLSSWNPPDSLQCPTCMSTLASPIQNQTYVFTAETEQGCIDTDSITVRVDPDPRLFIPNVFSPNHDGVNDFFQIIADPLSITSIDRFYIFDRWGGMLHHTSNIFNEGNVILWDGITARGPVNPGMYVYLMILTLTNNEQRSYSGDVTVVK